MAISAPPAFSLPVFSCVLAAPRPVRRAREVKAYLRGEDEPGAGAHSP
ncbi:hypothetical protein [Streptomyces aureus]|uniref:Uncharacterized protein n=1 Tax=Streptomyces aureus TaxID=193461 RepID=A0ABV4SWF8_9ACTN